MDAQTKSADVLDAHDIEENKDIAALGYVWILSFVVYFTRRNSPFVRYHAKQGMVLCIASIVCWPIPVLGTLLELLVLALAVIGFLAAAQGQYRPLPVVYQLSRGDWAGVRLAWKNVLQMVLDAWHRIHPHKEAQKTGTPDPAATPPHATPAPASTSQDTSPPSPTNS